jgi:phenylacetate-CoA ligase
MSGGAFLKKYTMLFSIYNRLPYPLRYLASSVRGLQLRWWRYGADTGQLIEESIERESWDREQWQAWRSDRLARILHRAATRVPYYREYWDGQRKRGDRRSWEALENWPILEKASVRSAPLAFIADDVSPRCMFVDHTGGTTGRPTLIYESRATVKKWFALFESRLRLWHQVTYKERWGIFGGQKITPLQQNRPPFWVRNLGLNQIYFSIFHISKRTARAYVDALNAFEPTHLIVYPSSLSVLAEHILEQGLQPRPMRVIFSNSEILFDHQKRMIEAAFQCPIVDTYGMAELVSAASQCGAGTMHAWPEMGLLELLDSQSGLLRQAGPGNGEFVFTSLLNDDMPLIRYRNGDSGSLPVWDYTCPCGRKLPRFGEIQGRANDLIKTPDGRKLYLLDSLFNGLPLVEAQLIQESLDCIVARIVPDGSWQETDARVLVDRLRQYLGEVRIILQPVESIPREGNGKFRPYISHLED